MSLGSGRETDNRVSVVRGMKPAAVRWANQRAILLIAAREPGLSNADIARRSGLAPQTVSAVLADLEDAGLLLRGAVRRGRRGQPATPMFLNPKGAFSVGVEIGWQHVEVVFLDFSGEELGRHWRRYDYPDASTIFEEVADQVSTMASKISGKERSRIVGLGLAAPGGIGNPTYILKPPGNQEQLWEGIDIVDRVEEVTGLPTHLYNDGNAACWAEFGAHPIPRPQNFCFLMVDTFLAAGIVAENRLWEGVTGASANLGSMLVAGRSGQPVYGHDVASRHALGVRLAPHGVDIDGACLPSASAAVRRTIDEWVEDAAFAIAQIFLNTATVIEYQTAILEAVLPASLREQLIAAARRQISAVPNMVYQVPTLIAGHIGRSGTARGAAQLRLYRRFFSRELEHMDE